LKALREASQVGEQANEYSWKRALPHFMPSCTKEERTVEILRGDFVKFRGLLDLAEVQGDYGVNV
jgi:hypothetical protein